MHADICQKVMEASVSHEMPLLTPDPCLFEGQVLYTYEYYSRRFVTHRCPRSMPPWHFPQVHRGVISLMYEQALVMTFSLLRKQGAMFVFFDGCGWGEHLRHPQIPACPHPVIFAAAAILSETHHQSLWCSFNTIRGWPPTCIWQQRCWSNRVAEATESRRWLGELSLAPAIVDAIDDAAILFPPWDEPGFSAPP